ncbi:Stk1 family PASTA domain-containing Ser/Thr kinase [Propionicimonas sp.]|uniref:Stk1 family PASTA domain-containing Ser/Thr kinase n=1 Tax=Propionicimonas sp. TaxID=1955623 RepID=UPI001859C44F|nr:Stk1 family PASTA domain-containing Ser/Thr kinase [Propionicimonas sp.]MBU3976924.1 Stk1 family PASTA domain-containing Ser/Thr kinase [Actinomycetota bacterium]MBA3020495.1 Stk1 family PASTA domain-containing Ser/Thr kinase [Propionicimonas sp.]MBU3986669.1 Stk1 family PASTA domain-containing Ser/Thr kinase [Actinomycetota bacterium]MBU4007179.1 Stk1 family PASTA domain-containing Ser/Thr kinase [Actinomycetota bacterium]MBU4064932.1 Stk1 family PASTA domain-containing Ser/Thr kinase [Act
MTTASNTDPLLGRVVDGRYRINRKLARGGMATVYLADDLRLTRTVAIKVMHENLGSDSDFVARFDHEARAAARLSHPSVVSVFDQGMDGERPYIVMEFVEGSTLRHVITREAPMTPIRAVDLISQVAGAVAAAHEGGIIHRDLKPENVLISPRGQLKVADFGLARAVTAHTATANGMLIGTVSYIAPELVTHGHADTRCDVYAMGIVLYEMLTGKKPHTGDTPIQVAYSHVHNDIVAPSTIGPQHNGAPVIPDYLDALVLAAAARQPADRPRDAKVLLDHLHAVRDALSRGVRSDAALAARMRQTTIDDADQVTTAVPMLAANGALATGPDEVSNATLMFDPAAGGPPGAASLNYGDGAPLPSPSALPLLARRARSRVRGRNALIAILALSLVLGVGGWYLLAGRFTSTPDFTNLTQAQAQDLAAKKGFLIGFDAAYSETIPVGQVVRTDPAKGERVPWGGTITVFLSKGPERYPVPSLVGRTVDDATNALKSSHLAVGKVTDVWDESVVIGLVVSASLEAGKSVKPGTQVDLNVSKGPAPVKIVSMVGKTFDEAKAYYEAAGLVVARAPEDKFSTKIPAGSVVSQSPKDGTLAKGKTITLTVSKGPEMVNIPDVGGLSANKAKKALTDAGFKVTLEKHFSSATAWGAKPQNPGVCTNNGGTWSCPKGSVVILVLY